MGLLSRQITIPVPLGDNPRGNQASDRAAAVAVALRVLPVLGVGRRRAGGGASARERRHAARAARLAAAPALASLPVRPQPGPYVGAY